MKRMLLLIATFFNIGYGPVAPGTWASLVTTITVFLLHPLMRSPLQALISAAIIIFLVGIPAAAMAEKHFGKKDPRPCVIDEVAGQLVALILVPHSPLTFLAAFLLFRLFDIIKPFPIRRLEKIKGGLGIMVDDVMAGLYALALIHLFIAVS
jgi:phosphatidylglycerophosphatase A